MNLPVLLLFVVVCVGCRGDELHGDNCSPKTDDTSCGALCALTELGRSTKCYFHEALEDATDSARVVSGLLTRSGKKALKYLGVQLLIPLLHKDTNVLYGKIDLSDQVPQTFGIAWRGDFSQIRDTFRATADYLKRSEAEGNLPRVNIGNILWSLKEIASYHGRKFSEWANRLSTAIHSLTRDPAHQFNLRLYVDEIIRAVPDHVLDVAKADIVKNSRVKREAQTSLDKFNRKTLDLLKVLTCRLFFENGLPFLCEDAVTMWDRIEQEFTSSQNQRNARSVPLVSVTESIFSDLDKFPFHLYLEPAIKENSESSGPLISSLRVSLVLKNESSPGGKASDSVSGRSRGTDGKIDLVVVLNACTHLLSHLSLQIAAIGDVAAAHIESVADLENMSIPPPRTPAKDVFSSYTKNDTLDEESRIVKRSVSDTKGVYKVMIGCVNTQWFKEQTSSGILSEYFDISSPNFQKILEGKIPENISNLKQKEKKEAFVESAVSNIVAHINSGNQNIKLGRNAQVFLSCIEFNYGSLGMLPIFAGVAGKTNVKEYAVKILDEWDYHLSQMVNIFKDMDAEERMDFVRTNVEDCLRVVLEVLNAFKLTRANPMCFTSHICHLHSKDLEKPSWRPELAQIVGLLVEFVRGIQDKDWDNLPYVFDVFLHPTEACKIIPDQACVEGSIYRMMHKTISRILPDSVMSLLLVE